MFIQQHLLELKGVLTVAGLLVTLFIFLVKPKKETTYLWIVFFVALLIQIRIGLFHNQNGIVHVHDMMHYQIGSKYFKETNYEGIYVAICQAIKDLEKEGATIKNVPTSYRNLDNKTAAHIDFKSKETEKIKNNFSEERWREFKNDILIWENNYSPNWNQVVADAGYNPPPTWTAWGYITSLLIPADKAVLLALGDWIALLLIFLIIKQAIGIQAALYSFIIVFFFPSGEYTFFNWAGGSLFRTTWVLWLTIGLVAYQKKAYKTAGAALTLAGLERVFPGAFLAAALLVSLIFLFKTCKINKQESLKPLKGLIIGSLICSCIVLILTNYLFGAGTWGEFLEHIKGHSQIMFANHWGWGRAVGFHPSMGQLSFPQDRMDVFGNWGEILARKKEWVFYKVWKYAMLCAVLVWTYRTAQGEKKPLAVAWLGSAIVFFFTMPANYYLIGLLPILTITYKNSHSMFKALIVLATVGSTIGILQGNLAFSLISLMICWAITWAGLIMLTKDKKPNGVTHTVGALIVIASLSYPQIIGGIKESNLNKATIVEPENPARITRNCLSEDGYEITDSGIILTPESRIKFTVQNKEDKKDKEAKWATTRYSNNKNTEHRKLFIRTDRYFDGKLLLKDLNGNTLHQWEVSGRGWLFDTLSCPIPNQSEFILTWEAKKTEISGNIDKKSDIGIFSIWINT